MTARNTIIDGKTYAESIISQVSSETADLIEQHGIEPGLAVVIVGEDPASQVYVRNKGKKARACGFHSEQHTLPSNVSQEEVLALVHRLNEDDLIHGILVQLPLPDHLDEETITQAISPAKDVDGFHYENIGKLTSGNTQDAFIPCTPAGCMLLIQEVVGDDLSGQNALIIGRSNIVGKPMASLLLRANATVTIAHSRTRNLPEMASRADILVAAVGRPRMVQSDWVKKGAVVIDVGINREEDAETGKTKLCGDVDFDNVVDKVSAITPVPGGVGPMTIAMLMANTLKSARRSIE